ncbi:3-dehydroquinate synthase [uncultured Amnibacterium sp.]|uniref:3-dehydroquinate synthase n=1 Tax=uncultured Amnibacterium sp. TaxID=1631851 RepID=UPI0035CC44ED
MTPVRIPVTNAGEYEVVIGRGLGDLVEAAVPAGARKALLIHQPVQARRAEAIRERLAGRVEVLLAEVPDAEDAKRIEVAAFCWGILGQADFTRTDAVIGLGGGAVTDLAGFVAATWLRGVPFISLPTSVLGMVDASVGGKTGINTTEGKNLVGAFAAPVAVLADLEVLDTLPRNDLLAGFAEIAKCGFIQDTAILDRLTADVETATDPASPVFAELVERAIRVKAEVVSEDFRESGRRETLNYGHTLGHAIEYAERYRWRHGAAISVGMVFVAELARLVGRLDDDGVALHREVLGSLSLPLTYPGGRWEALSTAMRRDKKSRAGLLRFVLLDGIGRTSILNGPEDHLLFTAYGEIAS